MRAVDRGITISRERDIAYMCGSCRAWMCQHPEKKIGKRTYVRRRTRPHANVCVKCKPKSLCRLRSICEQCRPLARFYPSATIHHPMCAHLLKFKRARVKNPLVSFTEARFSGLYHTGNCVLEEEADRLWQAIETLPEGEIVIPSKFRAKMVVEEELSTLVLMQGVAIGSLVPIYRLGGPKKVLDALGAGPGVDSWTEDLPCLAHLFSTGAGKIDGRDPRNIKVAFERRDLPRRWT